MASRMENSASCSFSSVLSASDAQKQQRLKLLTMCQRQELTDVVLLLQPEPLQCQDETMDNAQQVAAHRVVLASASPFFHALLTGSMKEAMLQTPVPLPGVPVAAFDELLRYMYIGELRVTGETILSVLHAANRLELQEVVEICCKQLILELNVHNCVDIYMCCEQLQMRKACKLLAQAARAMIDTYFSDVYQSEGFKNLSLEAVLKILRHQSSNMYRTLGDCRTDDAAVQAWMMHNPNTRQRELSLRSADNDEAPQIILSQRNGDNAMVNSKAKLLENTVQFDVIASEIEGNSEHQLTPTIFVIGGFNNPGALNTTEYLDFHRGEWHPAAPMTTRRSYSGVAVTRDNKIFVMGGTSSSSHHHNTMESYNPETNSWICMPPMKNARSYLGAAVVGDFIYVVGGFNGQAHLSSVERFDLQIEQWESMPPLSTGRSGLAVVALNGLVYAIGGYDGRKHLKSVEVFDPQSNQWSPVVSMRYARNGPAAVVQDNSNNILVFGGESRHGARMNTSERLDLNSGIWSDVDAFADCRSGHVAFSFLSESFLFCLGGSNKKDEYLDSVHRYDYLSKQWTLHSQMRAQRCGLNVAVVKTSSHAECFALQKQMGPQLSKHSDYLYRKYRGMSYADGA
ncbi:Kelch-like protein 5 isoform X1 [Phytophthora megakarya]|uniref:Kelch-like protein 5 isoform X1 n=1 Tax=Phytophthora megakarya TaxID=4795 RepID=A0A225UZS1_9STRA|nr:Kelch-like protein 5 isoform X1 [Phytophthora megakarya]